MTTIVRSTSNGAIRFVRMPVRMRAHRTDAPALVMDGHRYGSIGSLQALGLAAAAAVVTPALLWLVS